MIRRTIDAVVLLVAASNLHHLAVLLARRVQAGRARQRHLTGF